MTTIVFPLHKRGGKLRNNTELRFALRSLCTHFQGEFEVVIVGERMPDWAQGITHIYGKGLKSSLAIVAAAYPDGFFWWYDDCCLLKDEGADELKITPTKPRWQSAQTKWSRSLEGIRKRLEAEGYVPIDYSRDHGPYWFDKAMVDEGFQDWPRMRKKFPWESWILSKRAWPGRSGIVRQYYGAFRSPPALEHSLLNYNDAGNTDDLRDWLETRFPDPCKFERPPEPQSAPLSNLSRQPVTGSAGRNIVKTEGDRVFKVEAFRNRNKKNSLREEIAIIQDLNAKGCPCVPRLLDFGVDARGRDFMILQRIIPSAQPAAPEDIYLSYLAVRGCGWEHGDLCPRNVIFDGTTAWLIDFDQAFPADSARMGWSSGFIDPLIGTHFMELSSRPFDLSSTALARSGRSTATKAGIYHSFSEAIPGGRGVFIKGERSIRSRISVIDGIDFTGERVLDVGCNSGALARYVGDRGALGVDGIEFSREHGILGQMVNSATGRHHVSIRDGDISRVDFHIGTYDTVLLFSVLHHLRNPAAVAGQIAVAARRVIIEAALNESGSCIDHRGRKARASSWNFAYVEALTAHFLRMLPGFRFIANHGQGDRERYILEFSR